MLIFKVMLHVFSSFFNNVKLEFPILICCIILLIYLIFFEVKATIIISLINDIIIISEAIDCSDFDIFNFNLSKTICD